MSNLKKLNNIWKSMTEAEDVPRGTDAKSEPKKEDDTEASPKVETSSKKSLYGVKPEFIYHKDDNSKAPTPVEREMGSKQAVKEFKVTNTAMEVTEPVPREMGAQEAPNDYLKEYKSNIGKVLESIKESIKI